MRVRAVRATTTKAAHKRSQLGGERRELTAAVGRMVKARDKRIAELEARLAQADGLWRHWCAVDITVNDDEWAAFSDAVRDHLDGKPVPKRFLK